MIQNSLYAAALQSTIQQAARQGVETMAATMLGGAILAQFSRPLDVGAFAFRALATDYSVQAGMMMATLGGGRMFQPLPQAQWTASLTGQHTGGIDLGDGYTLQLDERNSEITILNANTGERTRIWGDPHVEIDGKHAFDFWGTTTFQLENGTKITIDTEQWGGNPNAYVASQLTITKGDNAIVVDGISQNQLGDLSVSMSQNSRALDTATRDGFVLRENASGAGWRSGLTGAVATQADLNATAVGALYGPGSTMPSLGEVGSLLGGFLTLGIFASAMIGVGNDDASPATARVRADAIANLA